jgi:hypothetical protein
LKRPDFAAIIQFFQFFLNIFGQRQNPAIKNQPQIRTAQLYFQALSSKAAIFFHPHPGSQFDFTPEFTFTG